MSNTVKAKPRVEKTIEPDLPVADDAAGIDDTTPDDGVVRIGKRGKAAANAPKRIHIFTIGETDYFINEPNVAAVVKFFRDQRRYGRDVAIEQTAFTLLGEEALTALAESPDTEPEDVADVFVAVSKTFFESPAYKAMVKSMGEYKRE